MFALGALLGGGHDVPTDRAAAVRWFHAAAERGHGMAQLMVGRYRLRGLAGPPDPVTGRCWIEAAAASGISAAVAALAPGGEAALPAPPPRADSRLGYDSTTAV
jgi:TPR repeat protein